MSYDSVHQAKDTSVYFTYVSSIGTNKISKYQRKNVYSLFLIRNVHDSIIASFLAGQVLIFWLLNAIPFHHISKDNVYTSKRIDLSVYSTIWSHVLNKFYLILKRSVISPGGINVEFAWLKVFVC